ncbi:hypothetical protein Z946_1883 [Sulfitobacter noctilucicola]|uniref:Copper(I)-binding protein n=1 Tax=Sulfitobacter noctilucicola TaxID=1342301 RepID=A0A7W6M4T9_9RHOB|nr:hypothetical protein [Sulfitobacter noctilucicola]KIN63020.1 hypothetical protein Z946_1883 [Sulfitobacter noctilucicola]MBB4172453.1 hypothetical protein [Sulfitobacter noctilucicola]
MSRSLALFVIGLTFGGGIGFAIAAASGAQFEGHDHNDPAHHGATADHSMMDHSAHAAHDIPIDVSPDAAPEVSITVMPDPMSGYNLHVMTSNFAFSPQNASRDHVAGEGHAHVYIDGQKLGRLYGDWLHIAALPKGEVEVSVSLNANDHSPLAVAGVPIAASQTVIVE